MSFSDLNNLLSSDFLTLSANLQRLSESEVIVVTGVLKQLELELLAELQDNPQLTEYTKRRFEALVNQNRATIASYYDKVETTHTTFLTQTAGITQAAVGRVFGGVGISVNSVVLTEEQLKSLASNSLIQGAPSSAWWSKQSNNLQDAFVNQMRIGYAAGETLDQLVQRVRGTSTGVRSTYLIDGKKKVYTEFSGGIMDTGTRQAQALVRTSVQQVSADAKLAVFRGNSDIIKAVEWLATLDTRTTKLCAQRDKLHWDLNGNPIGHKLSFLGGTPAHWGCRSTLSPVMKTMKELELEDIVSDERIAEAESASTRASMDGPVPASTNFEDWFGGLSKQDQVSYLGKKKYEIWKEKGLSFSQMTNQAGNPLTVQQLAATYGYPLPKPATSSIPAIPERLEPAISAQQQAQPLAAEITAKAAKDQTKSARLQITQMTKSQPVVSDIRSYMQRTGIWGEDPVSNLAYIEKATKAETVASTFLDKIKQGVAANISTDSVNSASFIKAKQQELALKSAQVNTSALPSELKSAYQANYKQITAQHSRAQKQIDKLLADNPYLTIRYRMFQTTREYRSWDAEHNFQQFTAILLKDKL